jgi:hypothetical protein
MARTSLRNTILGLGLCYFVVLISASLAWAADPNRLENGYCKSGYVWRDSYDGDGLCVTPAERTRAKAKAKAAAEYCKTQNGTMVKGVCFF